MADNPPFEIPPQVRELAEKSVEQARAAYGQFMDFLTQAMDAWSKAPSHAMMSRFRAVQERAIVFAKEDAEGSFALASELAHARDVQEVLTLQSRYAQAQIKAYAFQAQALGRLITDAMRDMQPSG
jgi:hypothetical protein